MLKSLQSEMTFHILSRMVYSYLQYRFFYSVTMAVPLHLLVFVSGLTSIWCEGKVRLNLHELCGFVD